MNSVLLSTTSSPGMGKITKGGNAPSFVKMVDSINKMYADPFHGDAGDGRIYVPNKYFYNRVQAYSTGLAARVYRKAALDQGLPFGDDGSTSSVTLPRADVKGIRLLAALHFGLQASRGSNTNLMFCVDKNLIRAYDDQQIVITDTSAAYLKLKETIVGQMRSLVNLHQSIYDNNSSSKVEDLRCFPFVNGVAGSRKVELNKGIDLIGAAPHSQLQTEIAEHTNGLNPEDVIRSNGDQFLFSVKHVGTGSVDLAEVRHYYSKSQDNASDQEASSPIGKAEMVTFEIAYCSSKVTGSEVSDGNVKMILGKSTLEKINVIFFLYDSLGQPFNNSGNLPINLGVPVFSHMNSTLDIPKFSNVTGEKTLAKDANEENFVSTFITPGLLPVGLYFCFSFTFPFMYLVSDENEKVAFSTLKEGVPSGFESDYRIGAVIESFFESVGSSYSNNPAHNLKYNVGKSYSYGAKVYFDGAGSLLNENKVYRTMIEVPRGESIMAKL